MTGGVYEVEFGIFLTLWEEHEETLDKEERREENEGDEAGNIASEAIVWQG